MKFILGCRWGIPAVTLVLGTTCSRLDFTLGKANPTFLLCCCKRPEDSLPLSRFWKTLIPQAPQPLPRAHPGLGFLNIAGRKQLWVSPYFLWKRKLEGSKTASHYMCPTELGDKIPILGCLCLPLPISGYLVIAGFSCSEGSVASFQKLLVPAKMGLQHAREIVVTVVGRDFRDLTPRTCSQFLYRLDFYAFYVSHESCNKVSLSAACPVSAKFFVLPWVLRSCGKCPGMTFQSLPQL